MPDSKHSDPVPREAVQSSSLRHVMAAVVEVGKRADAHSMSSTNISLGIMGTISGSDGPPLGRIGDFRS